MPNLDTGHYFLTVLAPIKNGSTERYEIMGKDKDGDKVSYRERLRFMLSILPTAFQSPATEWKPNTTERYQTKSPFAKCHRTHLCRFAVIEDAIYNGRDQNNAIIAAIKNTNPAVPQKVDRLSHAYLMFAADFDAVMEADTTGLLPNGLSKQEQDAVRDDYARSLWNKAENELARVFENCEHFDTVNSADSFAKYIANCQVETTMPFNDYWDAPPEDPPLYVFPMKAAVITIAALLGLFILGFLPWFNNTWLGSSMARFIFGGGAVAAVMGTYWLINRKSQNPMPAGKMASLRHVLKSLYLGTHFRGFIIDNQTQDDETLFNNFGQFLEQHKPDSLTEATQPSGVIGMDFRTAATEKAE